MADAAQQQTRDVSFTEAFANLPTLIWDGISAWLNTNAALVGYPAMTGKRAPEVQAVDKAIIEDQIRKASGGRDVSADIAKSNAEQDAMYKAEKSTLDQLTSGWRDYLPSLPSLDVPVGDNPISRFFKSLDETQRVVLVVSVVVVVVLIVVAASD